MNSKISILRHSLRTVLLLLFLLPLSSCAKEEKGPTAVIIYNHTDKGIMARVDGDVFGSVGPHGGGGSILCCVLIPAKWRPDLTATIEWSTGTAEWVQEYMTPEGESKGHYKEDWGPTETVTVPIPEYGPRMGDFQIHILRGGKVRVFVTPYTLGHKLHPLQLEKNPDADLDRFNNESLDVASETP